MSYGERLRQARKKLNLSQQELGKKLDVATMIISRLESNDTQLKASILTKIDQMGINISWLLTGKGDMFKQDSGMLNSYSVPIVDIGASAGSGNKNEQEVIIGTSEIGSEFKKYWGEDTIIIRVDGDSMSPTIDKNSWVLVRKSSDLKSEGVFIFLHDNELRCKRIQKKGTGEIIVKSDNPLYETEIYPKNSTKLGELVLLGEVVGTMRKV